MHRVENPGSVGLIHRLARIQMRKLRHTYRYQRDGKHGIAEIPQIGQ